MERLISLLESKRKNCSRGVQKALREIDIRILSRIMNKLDSKYHHIILENMTAKTQEILLIDMESEKEFLKSAYNDKCEGLSECVEMFCDVLELYTNENFDSRQEYPVYTAAINLDTPDRIITTFYNLSSWARSNGLMALDGVEQKTDNKFFQKAMEMMLAGTDPSLYDEILDNYLEQYVRKTRIMLNMIKTGMLSIQEGEHANITEEKLKSINEG
jgi:hypothetical protein